MGIPGGGPASAVALIEHLRGIRGDLLPTLLDFQKRLRQPGLDRTLVRIADGLMWGSYPDTWLNRLLGVAPRPPGNTLPEEMKTEMRERGASLGGRSG
jgi:hypothetical protein